MYTRKKYQVGDQVLSGFCCCCGGGGDAALGSVGHGHGIVVDLGLRVSVDDWIDERNKHDKQPQLEWRVASSGHDNHFLEEEGRSAH